MDHVARTRSAVLALLVAVALLGAACASDDTNDVAGGDDAGASTTAGEGGEGEGAIVDPASVEADPSEGCDAGGEVTLGQSRVDLTSGGVPRWYLLHVPSAHDGETPLPVVVDLHGYSEGAEVHRAMTGLGEYGEEQGFVAVFPHGDGPVPRWIVDPAGPDVDFIAAVLDEIEARLCVDRNRVFVTGLSNGAMMTSALMCAMADRFAAAAPVAGIQPLDGCEPARAVPVAAFHGTEDPFVSFEGGLGPAVADLPTPDGTGRLGDLIEAEVEAEGEAGTVEMGDDAPTVPEVTATWAERNGCDPEPSEEQLTADVVLVSFDCPVGGSTRLYRIDGGGHTWPGSRFLEGAVDLVGTTTFTISANEVMWAFFQAHPRGIGG